LYVLSVFTFNRDGRNSGETLTHQVTFVVLLLYHVIHARENSLSHEELFIHLINVYFKVLPEEGTRVATVNRHELNTSNKTMILFVDFLLFKNTLDRDKKYKTRKNS
jgi:hypothetical protein